ncbi:MAG: hypothetical protein ACHQNT_09720 [Bacteroidia bacterium]
MTNKIIAITLATIFLFFVAGGCLFLFIMQQVNYAEMNSKIHQRSYTEILTMPVSAFNRVKEGRHELRWQGKMYDISKVEIKNQTASIYCIYDEEEDEIIRMISGLMGKGKQSNAPLKIFSFLCDRLMPSSEISFYATCTNVFSHFVFSETQLLNKQKSPPPRV